MRSKSADRLKQLITPHGDWEPPVGMRSVLVALNSLPLMGIGNPSESRRARVYAEPHYPSWGLGTSQRKNDHWQNQGSLPLMGIGNFTFRGHKVGLIELITPHGDWELQNPCPLRGRHPHPHYPSWGLGTRSVNARQRNSCHLITPHGDWEPEQVKLVRNGNQVSLPLMGIGNLGRLARNLPIS